MHVILFLASLSYVIAIEDVLESSPSALMFNRFRKKRQFGPGGGGGFQPNFQNFQPQRPPAPWGSPTQNANGFTGQQLPQNGQGQFSFQGQGQSSSNQFGTNLQQQSSNSNQQAGSVSSNSNQPVLWNSNQNDYQCVLNNCRGQNQQWNPICGTDNLVYDNVAILRCAQQCGRRISFSYSGTCVITTTPASKK